MFWLGRSKIKFLHIIAAILGLAAFARSAIRQKFVLNSIFTKRYKRLLVIRKVEKKTNASYTTLAEK